MVQPFIHETEGENLHLPRENRRGRVPRRLPGSQETGDVLKGRDRELGILLFRLLPENGADRNEGQQPLLLPR